MYYSLRIVGGNVLSCNKKLITCDMHHIHFSVDILLCFAEANHLNL